MITVLMSAYNGERYIREQIDSILNQDIKGLNLLVRDDGSTDGTVTILEEYQAKGSLKFYANASAPYESTIDKIGKSFLDLCRNAPESEYYAFSDQDDFWEPNKLSVAVNMLERQTDKTIPLLYQGYAKPYGQSLEPIKCKKPNIKKRYLKYNRVLMTATAAGCTFVFNKPALDMLLLYKGEYVGIHDWLLERVVALTGKTVYDKKAHMKYRQHSVNAIGTKVENFTDKVKKHVGGKYTNVRSRGARLLLESYGGIIDKKKFRYLDALANYRQSLAKKLYLLLSFKCTGNNLYTKIGAKALILMNKL